MLVIQAKDFVDPDGVIVESAARLARRVVEELRDGGRVAVSMDGMGGVSSAYFNRILLEVMEAEGEAGLERLEMRIGSGVLRRIYEGSLRAVRAEMRRAG